jgi:Zn-finger nucleic acid-binding protein
MQQMTCPKCKGFMRQYERSGVILDQCEECRGIFLDRGELEKLVDAENSYYGRPRGDEGRRDERYDDRRRYDERRYDDHGDHHKKKKSSFFEELFD